MANDEERKKAAEAKVEAGIYVLRQTLGVSETAVRRFVEASLNKHRHRG